jgi:hypothetical protein
MIKSKIKSGSVILAKTGVYLRARTEDGRSLSFHLVNLPELTAFGVSNITHDQYYVLFLDFDNITLEELKRQIAFIYKTYDVSHFFILTTGPNRFHVISFEKFTLAEFRDVIDNTFCDYAFRSTPIRSDKGWILRFAPKIDKDGNVKKDRPEYVDFIWYKTPKRKLSRAHIEFFSKFYPQIRHQVQNSVPLAEVNWDTYMDINVINYGTSERNIITNFGLEDLVNSKKLEIRWEREQDGGAK